MMDSIAFKTLKRPSSPNTFLLAPEGFCEQAKPDQISKVIGKTPDATFQAILDVIAAEESWAVHESDAARGLVHFVSTSRLMRYKDDVDVLILPGDDGAMAGTGSRLAIYSRSRVGHSDLGANRKRVKYFLEQLNKHAS